MRYLFTWYILYSCLFLNLTCFGCPDQPSSGEFQINKNNTKGLSLCIFCVSDTSLMMADMDSRNMLQCTIKD
jgi:hypothetical protein